MATVVAGTWQPQNFIHRFLGDIKGLGVCGFKMFLDSVLCFMIHAEHVKFENGLATLLTKNRQMSLDMFRLY